MGSESGGGFSKTKPLGAGSALTLCAEPAIDEVGMEDEKDVVEEEAALEASVILK